MKEPYGMAYDDNPEQQTVSESDLKTVVNSEKITGAKLQLIINYIEEGQPDIKVIKAELGELILRESGEYFTF